MRLKLRAASCIIGRPNSVRESDSKCSTVRTRVAAESAGRRIFSRCSCGIPCQTQVTDKGLRTLKSLTQLQELWLDSSQVTDRGLEHLKRRDSTPNLVARQHPGHGQGAGTPQMLNTTPRVVARSTQVTDRGLEHLKGVTQLQTLSLDNNSPSRTRGWNTSKA